MDDLLSEAQSQKTTGFLVVQGGKTVVEKNWPAPADAQFGAFAYETTAEGALLEDVASQQKSFVAMLAAIAEDKGLLDASRPVSAYSGTRTPRCPGRTTARSACRPWPADTSVKESSACPA